MMEEGPLRRRGVPGQGPQPSTTAAPRVFMPPPMPMPMPVSSSAVPSSSSSAPAATASPASTYSSRPPGPASSPMPSSPVPLPQPQRETVASFVPEPQAVPPSTFMYGKTLSYAMGIPMAILIAFGGKPTLLVLAFGSLLAYIFDILGSIEGTLMMALVTTLGLWTSLIWAARLLLKQSMLNFVVVIVQGLLLAYQFFVLAAFFRSVRFEFDTTFFFMETLIFSTLPLLSAILITWFVCVEFPSLDMPTVFSTAYFVYALILCKPRPSSVAVVTAAAAGRDGSRSSVRRVLTPTMTVVVYAVPVYLAPFIHAASHHHAIYRAITTGSFHSILELAASSLYPLLLMSIAAERHVAMYPPGAVPSEAHAVVGATKTISLCGLLACIQSHPFLVDLKAASRLSEPSATLLYVGMAGLSTFGVFVSSRAQAQQSGSALLAAASPLEAGGKKKSLAAGGSSSLRLLVTCVAAAVSLLVGLAVRLPKSLLLMCAVGGGLFAEYSQRWSGHGRGWAPWFTGQALVFAAGFCASIAALSATGPSLYFLDVTLSWHGVDVTIKQLCVGFMFVASSVFTVASLALQSRPAAVSASSALLLPTSSRGDLSAMRGGAASADLDGGKTAAAYESLSGAAFSVAFAALLFVVTAFELFVREQNWIEWEADVEDVYPSALLGATALALALLSTHLHGKSLLNTTALWACVSMQAFKLAHLLGQPSNTLAAAWGVFLVYSGPFVAHVGLALSPSAASLKGSATASAPSSVGPMRLWGYFVGCVTVTAFARVHLLHALLESLLARDVTAAQSSAAAVALMAGFACALLWVFAPAAAFLRSLLLAAAGLAVLVTFDSLPVALDASSPTLLVLAQRPDLYDNSGMFLVLSAALLVLAAGGVIAVRRPVSHVLFVAALTYCAGRALAGWAFPMSMGADSPHYGFLQLPALYCFASVFLATLASLQATSPTAGAATDGGANATSLLLALLPMAALLYAMWAHEHEHHAGIVWAAFATQACTAFTTRCGDLTRDLTVSSDNKRPSSSSSAAAVCTMSALLAIAWNFWGSVSTAHVDADTSVPLSFLLLLCTPRSMLVRDAHPLAVAAVCCAGFWLLSTLHSVFVKNFGLENKPEDFEVSFGLFKDEDVSFWSSSSPYHWVPLLNLALALVPLPAVFMAFRRSKADTEEMAFVLAVLSCVSVVGAQCWSVRYLGATGLIFAAWRCYEVGAIAKEIVRLI